MMQARGAVAGRVNGPEASQSGGNAAKSLFDAGGGPGGKGVVEAAITSEMVHYQAELTGHGPTEARTYILEDMVIVRFKGILSRIEQRLAQQSEGRRLIKQMRTVLREGCSEELQEIVARETGCKVVSSHADISTRTGEWLEIYVLDRNLERTLRRRDDLPEGGR